MKFKDVKRKVEKFLLETPKTYTDFVEISNEVGIDLELAHKIVMQLVKEGKLKYEDIEAEEK